MFGKTVIHNIKSDNVKKGYSGSDLSKMVLCSITSQKLEYVNLRSVCKVAAKASIYSCQVSKRSCSPMRRRVSKVYSCACYIKIVVLSSVKGKMAGTEVALRKTWSVNDFQDKCSRFVGNKLLLFNGGCKGFGYSSAWRCKPVRRVIE